MPIAALEYPQLTRKFLTPWLASVLFALKIFPKEFYCQDCHFTWPGEGEEKTFRVLERRSASVVVRLASRSRQAV